MNKCESLAPWPIVSAYPLELDNSALRDVAHLAGSLQSDEPALADRDPYGRGIPREWQRMPTLYLEDHRSIQLQAMQEAQNYEYRSFALSSSDDVFLRSLGRVTAFEQYQRDYLQFGADTVLTVDMSSGDSITLAKACVEQSHHMDYLASRARVAGGMNICPYLVTEDVWLLAAKLEQRSDNAINVIGPTARLVSRANDKLWFTDMAGQVLGRNHLPTSCYAYTLGAAIAELRYLARKNSRVVLKTPSSAGSAGNFIFDSQAILAVAEDELRQEVETRLMQAGWSGNFPLLTATWEAPVQLSPSVQIWIPSGADGLPIIEGFFSQTLTGSQAGFSGAKPAELPHSIRQQMINECGLLASCLQQLGYFGRVSFDAIVLGENAVDVEIHWIECNARWGGVSIPMTVANRIAATHQAQLPIRWVVQKPCSAVSVRGFETYIDSLGADLLDTRSLSEGIVCLTPVGEPNALATLLIMASDDDSAKRLVAKASHASTRDAASVES